MNCPIEIFILIAGVDLQVQVAMDRASQPCPDSQCVKEAGAPRDLNSGGWTFSTLVTDLLKIYLAADVSAQLGMALIF